MWLKNGRAILADGRAVLCDECPCDICTWQELESYIAEDGYPALMIVEKSAPCKTIYVNSQLGGSLYTSGYLVGPVETGSGTKNNPYINLNSAFSEAAPAGGKRRIILTGTVDYYTKAPSGYTYNAIIEGGTFCGAHPYASGGTQAMCFLGSGLVFKGSSILTWRAGLTYSAKSFVFNHSADGNILNGITVHCVSYMPDDFSVFSGFISGNSIDATVVFESVFVNSFLKFSLFSGDASNAKFYRTNITPAEGSHIKCNGLELRIFAVQNGSVIDTVNCNISQLFADYSAYDGNSPDSLSYIVSAVDNAVTLRNFNIRASIRSIGYGVHATPSRGVRLMGVLVNSNAVAVLINSSLELEAYGYGYCEVIGLYSGAAILIDCDIATRSNCIGDGAYNNGRVRAGGINNSNSIVASSSFSVVADVNDFSMDDWQLEECIYIGNNFTLYQSSQQESRCVVYYDGAEHICTPFDGACYAQ